MTAEDSRPTEPQQSLEDALDSLLAADWHNEETSHENTATVEPIVPDAVGATQRPSTEFVGPLNRAASRRQRLQERYARVFGTVEDVQQDDYESPLSTMYNRAWNRYRQAEDLRAIDDTGAPPLTGLSIPELSDVNVQLLMRDLQAGREPEGNVWSYDPVRPDSGAAADGNVDVTVTPPWMTSLFPSAPPGASIAARSSTDGGMLEVDRGMSEIRTSPELEHITNELRHLEAILSGRHAFNTPRAPDRPLPTLDNQPDRPPPKTDAEMTRTLTCQVCYQQLADIAVLPCGHMVMCQWCAEVVVPVKHSHIPIRPSKCPMCRKQIKQRFKIHTG